MSVIIPPLVVDVRVKTTSRGQSRQGRRFRIWFPFFLLWPLLLIVVGFALLISAVVDFALFMAGARYHEYTLFLVNALRLLSETRGTQAHIVSADALVDVDIY